MTVLGFEPRAQVVNGRRVRASRLEKRSLLPVSAACVVANGVRQTLGELFGTVVTLRLLEPVLPTPAAWAQVCDGALLYAARGECSDAAFVIRPDDAVALAGAALRERIEVSRPLSVIESELVFRLMRALSGTLAAVCGAPRETLTKRQDLTGFATYFELVVEQPISARIGVALSREPLPAVHSEIAPQALGAVELELSVEAAHAFLPVSCVASLRAGHVVTFDSVLGDAAIVRAGETVVGHGECGDVETRRVVVLR